MRNCASFRITSHVLMYSAIVCWFGPFRYNMLPFVLICAAVFVTSFIAVRIKQTALRAIIAALPAGLLLIPVTNPIVLAAEALPVIYSAASLIAARFDVEIWQLRKEVIVFFVLGFFVILASLIENFDNLTCRFLVVFSCLFAVLGLRALRTGRSENALWQAGNALIPLLIIAGAMLIGLGLWHAAPAFAVFARALAAMFGAFFVAWNAMWERIMNSVEQPSADFSLRDSPYPSMSPEAEAGIQGGPSTPDAPFIHIVKPDLPWGTIFLAVLLALLAVGLVVLIVRGASSRSYKKKEALEFELDFEKPGRRKKKRRKDEDSRSRLRAVYRRYLSFLSVNGVHPRLSETTEDISRSASEILLAETDELLRGYYRRARYSDEPVTKEDVAAAEAALEKLINDENVKKAR